MPVTNLSKLSAFSRGRLDKPDQLNRGVIIGWLIAREALLDHLKCRCENDTPDPDFK